MRNNCIKAMVLILVSCWFAADVKTAGAQTLQLINLTNNWRYNQSGANLGTAWQARTYDDTVAGWEGPGTLLFGFEGDVGRYDPLGVFFNTTFPNPQTAGNFRTNYYFRTHFTMPNYSAAVLAATTLTTTNWFDDGVVYYLNGVELLRTNMPTGTITATTFALAALTEPIQRVISNLGTNLLVGDNVLAAELHQVNLTSSDEVFGMTMTAVLPLPPVITTQPVGLTNIIGSTNILFVVATGSAPLSYQWFSNSVAISGATASNYTIISANVFAADYTVRVSNIVTSVTSDAARVSIVIDTFPPTLVSAVAGPPPASRGSNQVDVVFSEAVDNGPVATDPNSALGTNHYTISILGTSTTIPVTQAQANNALVRLTIPAGTGFFYGTNYVLCVNGVADKHTNIIAANSCIGIGVIRTNLPPAPTPLTNMVANGKAWYWLEPDHEIGTAWHSTNYVADVDGTFSDGVWVSSPSVICYEANATPCPGWSLLPQLDTGPLTYYFRTRFVAPSNTLPSGILYLTNFFDDGVIFYLNGTEIYRANMPSGPVSIATPSSSQVGPACSFALISVTNMMMPPPATNVLSAELHESGSGSDFDVYFGSTLTYTSAPPYSPYFTNFSPLPPRLSIVQQATTSTNVISWTTNVGGYNWGLDTTTNLGSNAAWSPLPNTSPYTNTINGRRFFRLRAK